MNRRQFTTTCIPFLFFSTSAHAHDVQSLIQIVTSARAADLKSIEVTASSAEQLGWQTPRSLRQMRIVGSWWFQTDDDQRGQITFRRGGKLSYATESKLPFTEYVVLTKAGAPALLQLKTSDDKDMPYQVYRDEGVALLSLYTNRSKWIYLFI